MLYVFFLILAIAYNWSKFRRQRSALLASLMEAKSSLDQQIILLHHFYIFIFECFISIIVANLIQEGGIQLGLLSLGFIYLLLIFSGFIFYLQFIKHLEVTTKLSLEQSFRSHFVSEFRTNFSVIFLPILIYSAIHWLVLDNVQEDWGRFWFLGLLFNILLVSVLTIVCSVVIMLKLIPNREITEPEYLEVIQRRLNQLELSNIRLRWIEADIKNAFVVGMKLINFNNQTMFIGRSLRTALTLGEFDAVISHELGHIANRHINRRILNLLKNFLVVILGILFWSIGVFVAGYFIWGEDSILHVPQMRTAAIFLSVGWTFISYVVLFDSLRGHEFEADGFAVIKLGAQFEDLKSALEKLSKNDDLPQYLKKISPSKENVKKSFFLPLRSFFSTHPDLSTRLNVLEKKITYGMDFNHYPSIAFTLRKKFSYFVNWKSAVYVSLMVLVTSGLIVSKIYEHETDIVTIHKSTTQDLIQNPVLAKRINGRSIFHSKTLMFNVVLKRDPVLINFYLKSGADPAKVIEYLAQTKQDELFKVYFTKYVDELSPEEFYLILRKSHRTQLQLAEDLIMAKSDKLKQLHPEYIEELKDLGHMRRVPASLDK
jgi:Zn-dependent protease with chaperone function